MTFFSSPASFSRLDFEIFVSNRLPEDLGSFSKQFVALAFCRDAFDAALASLERVKFRLDRNDGCCGSISKFSEVSTMISRMCAYLSYPNADCCREPTSPTFYDRPYRVTSFSPVYVYWTRHLIWNFLPSIVTKIFLIFLWFIIK